MSRQDVSLTDTVIDTAEFARSGCRLIGKIPLADMTRVSEMLADRRGALAVVLHGSRDVEGRRWLDLAVTGELVMACQRCLGPLRHFLRVDSRLQLVAAGEPWPDEELTDDASDAIPAEKEQAVLGLVEDEVLLALPIAPKHKKCGAPDEVPRDETVASPFAVLAGLKKR